MEIALLAVIALVLLTAPAVVPVPVIVVRRAEPRPTPLAAKVLIVAVALAASLAIAGQWAVTSAPWLRTMTAPGAIVAVALAHWYDVIMLAGFMAIFAAIFAVPCLVLAWLDRLVGRGEK